MKRQINMCIFMCMIFIGNFLIHTFFWLNSHPGRACLVLRACRSATFLDHDMKKGCEFNQKRCEFQIFLFILIQIKFEININNDELLKTIWEHTHTHTQKKKKPVDGH